MKIIIVALTLALSINLGAQKLTLNPKTSTAEWIGYGEIGGFKQEGSIEVKSGNIFLKDNQVQDGVIIFDAKSIDHQDKKLKKHLKAKDFFHAKKYPDISFEITGTYENKVFGKLTIRDKTIEETVTFETIQKEGLLIFAGKASIDRTKYDIKYNSSSYFQDLGNYAIKNEIDLIFNLVFMKAK